MGVVKALAEAMRNGRPISADERRRIVAILEEANKLGELASDARVSSELIGIRVRNSGFDSIGF